MVIGRDGEPIDAPRGMRQRDFVAGWRACERNMIDRGQEIADLEQQLQGAVVECGRLRVFERAFAKVPQEQQARIMRELAGVGDDAIDLGGQ